jgi:hypothetical protein
MAAPEQRSRRDSGCAAPDRDAGRWLRLLGPDRRRADPGQLGRGRPTEGPAGRWRGLVGRRDRSVNGELLDGRHSYGPKDTSPDSARSSGPSCVPARAWRSVGR